MLRRIGLVLAIVAVASLPLVRRAIAELTIDLRIPNAVNVVLYGREAEDYFGTDLAAGDINGDGLDDLAVGAYLADGPDNSRNGAGEVYVYYSKSASDWLARGRLPDITVYGAKAGDLLGGDMFKEPGHIAVGDLDNDGLGDLVLSVPKFGWGISSNRGRVYIIWGRDDLPGVIDLAMSAPHAEIGSGRLFCGIVYVISGGSHLRARDIQLSAIPQDVSIFQAIGGTRDTKLGSYLTFGKLSDDGVDDLVIGAEAAGDAQMGTALVVFGGRHVRGTTWDFALKPPSWSVVGEASLDQLGRSLATGDINADGQVDLILGAPTADGPAGANTGQTIGIFGPLEQGQGRDLAIVPGDLIIYGPQGGDDPAWLGESVAVSDFDGDGVDDLLVGARQANGFDSRNESGIVYMFFGGPSLEGARDLRLVAADITLVGATARDFTGYVTAGDVTGDGIADMIASATDRAGLNEEPQAGAAYILFGSQVPPTPMPTMTPTTTPTVTPTATPTVTATPNPSRMLYLPLILRNHVVSPS